MTLVPLALLVGLGLGIARTVEGNLLWRIGLISGVVVASGVIYLLFWHWDFGDP